MKKSTLLILILAGALIFSLFWNVNDRELINALELEKQRDKKALENKDEHIRELEKTMAKHDLDALQAIQSEKIRADRAEENLTMANEKLKSVRFVRFANDSVRSGAISELYPSYQRP